MRKLSKPIDDPGAVFMKCISLVQDPDLLERLTLCKEAIVTAAEDFEEKALHNLVHTIASTDGVDGIVTTAEMKAVYNFRMARKDSPGRPIYDKIITAPKYGRCPLCDHRVVSTLDHYLAKSGFPALAVVPVNLVPACLECNKVKLAAAPTSAEEEMLHPYFDDIEGDEWLFADIIEENPPSILFYVDSPSEWEPVLSARVENHFDKLHLNKLYASNAADELVNISGQLVNLFVAGGAGSVKAHLTESAASRKKANVNSWQTAFYRCLSASDWYCNGGFDF